MSLWKQPAGKFEVHLQDEQEGKDGRIKIVAEIADHEGHHDNDVWSLSLEIASNHVFSYPKQGLISKT